jgi:hypothetical protein
LGFEFALERKFKYMLGTIYRTPYRRSLIREASATNPRRAREGSRTRHEAAAEFQKIVDHRGVVVNAPIGALAHLGLARAYELQGDAVKARAAYQDFLTLWKDADL